MNVTYMGLIGDRILQYHCTIDEAKEACDMEAKGLRLVWEHETEGVHRAEDVMGHQFSVVQYQRA